MFLGHAIRITKKEFYRNGGFANTRQYRKHNGRNWTYWFITG